MMVHHVVGPPGDSLFGVPVWEDSVPRPYGSDILAAVRVVEKHTALVAVCVDRVVVACVVGVWDVDRRVDLVIVS